TGVVIAPEEVMTVAMVAERGEKVPIHGPDGEIEGEVIGFDPGSGLALLRAPGLATAVSVHEGEVRVGELGVTVACPIPSGHEARLAMVRCVGGSTRLRGGRRVERYLQTDASRFRGFSAAVHFDASGAAVGMTMPVGRREEPYLLPMDLVVAIAGRLREGRSTGTAYLGVQTTPVELPVAANGMTRGLLVTGVEDGSPAHRAGVHVGHFLLSVNGAATAAPEELYDALGGVDEGATLELLIADGSGETRTLEALAVLRS
ncbi:MAG: S1C family serine protease, partial [Spirochaetota bacterium]